MAEKPPPKNDRKEESSETKTNLDSSINWPELMLLIEKKLPNWWKRRSHERLVRQ